MAAEYSPEDLFFEIMYEAFGADKNTGPLEFALELSNENILGLQSRLTHVTGKVLRRKGYDEKKINELQGEINNTFEKTYKGR